MDSDGHVKLRYSVLVVVGTLLLVSSVVCIALLALTSLGD